MASTHATAPRTEVDPELLSRARAGDAAALETLLEQHQPQLLRFAMRMCSNPDDAQDVLQESMLAAARNLDGFRGDASLSSWLYTIARSFCIKQRRRRQGQPRHTESLDALHAAADPARAPDDSAADHELLAALERALEELDPQSREVLLLRDVEGLSANEAAEALEMSVPQLKSRLHRARIQVREKLVALSELPRTAPAEGCPDIALLFSQNLEGDIGPELCTRMQEHIDGCAACRATCDGLKRMIHVCQKVETPTVPKPLQDSLRAAIRSILAGTPQKPAGG